MKTIVIIILVINVALLSYRYAEQRQHIKELTIAINNTHEAQFRFDSTVYEQFKLIKNELQQHINTRK